MSQLNTALDRLDSAIDRLQSAISTREQRAGVATERLTVELRDVKATHAILEAEARNVSTRLELDRLQSDRAPPRAVVEQQLADTLEQLASRLESIAAQLEAA